jgi:hypothetical protein
MKRASWICTEAHTCPAGYPNQCCYCPARIGEEHILTCVHRGRTIVVRLTIEMVRVVPEAWDSDQIAFHMNDSSWCASNIISEIDAMFGGDARCLCGNMHSEFLREATEADELYYGKAI